MDDCIFCKIARNEIPCHKVWEDKKHIAFLTPFGNTEGFTVVIPKKHYPSYAFDLPDAVLKELVMAAKTVGKRLDASFSDVGRTGMIFEGFGVDHVHAKLFPMHGTKMKRWRPITSENSKVFKKYEGYISSHDAMRRPAAELERTARRIRGS